MYSFQEDPLISLYLWAVIFVIENYQSSSSSEALILNLDCDAFCSHVDNNSRIIRDHRQFSFIPQLH